MPTPAPRTGSRARGEAASKLAELYDFITGRLDSMVVSVDELLRLVGFRRVPGKVSVRTVLEEFILEYKEELEKIDTPAARILVNYCDKLLDSVTSGAPDEDCDVVERVFTAVKLTAPEVRRRLSTSDIVELGKLNLLRPYEEITEYLEKSYKHLVNVMKELPGDEHRVVVAVAHILGCNWLTKLVAEAKGFVEVVDKLAAILALLTTARKWRAGRITKRHIVETVAALLGYTASG